jgi:hypothetical protein
MATPQYGNHSPYANTKFFGNFLDVAELPTITKQPDDVLFTINKTYQYRPDLLAFDLYGDADFWWVFAMRNPNTIKDPIGDMKPGTQIFLPKKDTLTSVLGR